MATVTGLGSCATRHPSPEQSPSSGCLARPTSASEAASSAVASPSPTTLSTHSTYPGQWWPLRSWSCWLESGPHPQRSRPPGHSCWPGYWHRPLAPGRLHVHRWWPQCQADPTGKPWRLTVVAQMRLPQTPGGCGQGTHRCQGCILEGHRGREASVSCLRRLFHQLVTQQIHLEHTPPPMLCPSETSAMTVWRRWSK